MDILAIFSSRRGRLGWQTFCVLVLPLLFVANVVKPSGYGGLDVLTVLRWAAVAGLAGVIFLLALKRAHDLGVGAIWLMAWIGVFALSYFFAGAGVYLALYHPILPKIVSLLVAAGMLASLYQLAFKLALFAGAPGGNRYGAPDRPLSPMEAINERYPIFQFDPAENLRSKRVTGDINARIEATMERSTKAPGRVANAPAADRIGMALRKK